MRKEAQLPLISWALYDFANSAFSAIVQTFVFGAYFTKLVAVNELRGSVQWGYTNSLAAVCVAIVAPLLGSIIDKGAKSKPWILLFTYLCVTATASLWFVTPHPEKIPLALSLLFLGILSSELAFVIYNVILCDLTNENNVGWWSGWGWGLGYMGGLLSMGAVILIMSDKNPLLSAESAKIRLSFPLAALWYALFSLPFFLFTPGLKTARVKRKNILLASLRELYHTLCDMQKHRKITLFLLARLFFINGLTTIFVFGGVFAATIFNMSGQQIALFGLVIQLFAGIGSFIFAKIDDIIGSKKLILISLIGLIIPCFLLLFIRNTALFWVATLILGTFVGPVQAASRSLMARLAPHELKGKMFGLFAFSGKITNFAGPLLVSLSISASGRQEAGIAAIIAMLFIGFAIMKKV